ncbi:MAG: hypothetical protein COU40_03125 [Candidatus Moranbacteria bacterium CG10_big_fil_rev_8_21_14_0_10_35_21]|nr:MAG: hypothetical protein COU40_03125 [Candidatus Moranbacteria bacterium CG10_big_fil_rev_8_21_14_0_10_35_21]PJA88533.1 MAG: hypothetical protein CO139_02725 [Candidatus Moranbacteria bacterium CG_4_9_14_3_um_filter_36_9]
MREIFVGICVFVIAGILFVAVLVALDYISPIVNDKIIPIAGENVNNIVDSIATGFNQNTFFSKTIIIFLGKTIVGIAVSGILIVTFFIIGDSALDKWEEKKCRWQIEKSFKEAKNIPKC